MPKNTKNLKAIQKRPPLQVRIPSGLDVDSLVPRTLKPAKRAKYIDGIRYFLDLLFPQAWDFKKHKQLSDSGYILLNSTELKKVIGDEYLVIVDLLTIADVIKVDRQFIIGKHSRGYRITQEYYRETVPVTVTDKGMCKRYWKREMETRQQRAQSTSSIPFVTKWLDAKYIGIDLDGAHNFIETYREMMLEKWRDYRFRSDAKKTEAKYRIQNRCFYQRYIVAKIERGEITFKRDDAGRLYSPFVHLKKELRCFLTMGGKRLCSIDIKASQPYFFQKLLDRRFWMTGASGGQTIYHLHKERYQQLQAGGNRKIIIEMLKNLEGEYGLGFGGIPFKNIRWEDDFYEHLRSVVHEVSSDPKALASFRSRRKVKQTVMLLLYDNYEHKKPPYYGAFKKLFPEETKIMDAIKQAQYKDVFPTILQAVEANAVLDKACKAINERYPSLPFVTIHDSVVCDYEYVDRVEQILKDTLHQIIGVVPGLKRELLDKETVVREIQKTVDDDWADVVYEIKKIAKKQDWVGSFNEDPKEIPLLGYIRYKGRLHLERRIAFPVFEQDYCNGEYSLASDGRE